MIPPTSQLRRWAITLDSGAHCAATSTQALAPGNEKLLVKRVGVDPPLRLLQKAPYIHLMNLSKATTLVSAKIDQTIHRFSTGTFNCGKWNTLRETYWLQIYYQIQNPGAYNMLNITWITY